MRSILVLSVNPLTKLLRWQTVCIASTLNANVANWKKKILLAFKKNAMSPFKYKKKNLINFNEI